MKKIIFILFCFIFGSYLVKAETIRYEIIPNVYSKYTVDNVEYYSPLAYIFDENDNNIYCIQKGVFITTHDYETFEDFVDYSEDSLKRMELISYYGYGHKEERTKDLYIATQELLWEELGYEIEWYTDNDGAGQIIDVSNEKNIIMNRVNRHDLKPRFDLETISAKIGDTYTIFDLNGSLVDYFLYNDSGNIIVKDNNKVHFNFYRAGSNKIYFRKDFRELGKTKLFKADNSQTLMYFGNIYADEVIYNYSVRGGELYIQKVDFDTGLFIGSGEATLEFGGFSIYDEHNNLIRTLVSDANGFTMAIDLDYGNYIIREDYPSEGYLENFSDYHFEVSYDQPDYYVYIPSRVLKKQINILNYYEDDFIYPAENNEFLISSVNMDYSYLLITDKYGYAFEVLPYGSYLISQQTVKEGYEISNAFNYIVDFSESINDFEIINKKVLIDNEEAKNNETESETESGDETSGETTTDETTQEEGTENETSTETESEEVLPKLYSGEYFIYIIVGVLICLKRLY